MGANRAPLGFAPSVVVFVVLTAAGLGWSDQRGIFRMDRQRQTTNQILGPVIWTADVALVRAIDLCELTLTLVSQLEKGETVSDLPVIRENIEQLKRQSHADRAHLMALRTRCEER